MSPRRVALAALALLSVLAGPAGSERPSEYDLKAAVLVRLPHFVTWPESALPDSTKPLVIGVLGRDPFGRRLEDAAEGKTAQSRRLEIRRCDRVEEATGCHIVYVAGSESRRLTSVLQALAQEPVLTVGEDEWFARRGGIVQLRLDADRVSFEIDTAAASAAGLRISSQLLRLARPVDR